MIFPVVAFSATDGLVDHTRVVRTNSHAVATTAASRPSPRAPPGNADRDVGGGRVKPHFSEDAVVAVVPVACNLMRVLRPVPAGMMHAAGEMSVSVAVTTRMQ
jgi:hypothetical protein